MKKMIIGAFAAITMAAGAASLTACGSDDNPSAPAAPKTPSSHSEPAKPAPKKAQEPSKADDVTRFELVDKSQNFGGSAWVDDVEIAYTVTNHSSKSSNYVIEWEVTNDAGVRIANSSEFVTTLAPGQTTKGTDVLVPITHQQYIDGTNLKITNVERMYDWS